MQDAGHAAAHAAHPVQASTETQATVWHSIETEPLS